MNKLRYLEAMESANEHDLIAVTETWLNPATRDSELLINTAINIYRRVDIEEGMIMNRVSEEGGVMLAVRHHLI